MQWKDLWLGHISSVIGESPCALLFLIGLVYTRGRYSTLGVPLESVLQHISVRRQKYAVRMEGGGNQPLSRRRFHILDRLDDLCSHIETAERRHDIGSLDALAKLAEEINGDFNTDIGSLVARLLNSLLDM